MKDQYLANLLFAEKLLRFLYREAPLLFGFRVLWEPKLTIEEIYNQMEVPEFYTEIFWSVYYIINKNIEDITACYEDFRNDVKEPDVIDDANFAKCALDIAPSFFSEGYSHGSFLGYCAMVMGVAYSFLLLNPNFIPRQACQVIGLVLFTHQMTGEFYEAGSWSSLYDVSFKFNEYIQKFKKKQRRRKH